MHHPSLWEALNLFMQVATSGEKQMGNAAQKEQTNGLVGEQGCAWIPEPPAQSIFCSDLVPHPYLWIS